MVNLIRWLFNSKKGLANKPIAQAAITQASEDRRNKISFRKVLCNVCNELRDARFNTSGYVLMMKLGSHSDSSDERFVQSCEDCDLDICFRCAIWAPSTNSALQAAIAEPIYAPKCPRCGRELDGKTTVDFERVVKYSLKWKERMIAGDNEQVRKLSRRLLEIWNEEDPAWDSNPTLKKAMSGMRPLLERFSQHK